MAIVDLLEEEAYAEEVRSWDRKMRQYTTAPGMTPYVRSAAHHLPYLANMANEHLYVMPTRRLPRRLKEMIAVAVSMVNGCSYCITAHGRLLRSMFGFTDQQLVELAAATAHVSGVNRFETATMSDEENPLFRPRQPDGLPTFQEIQEVFGRVPLYYQIMANDPGYLSTVWDREKATMLSGTLERKDKEFVAYAVSIVNIAPYSTRFRKEVLEGLGATVDELFEALEVVEVFHKNNKFTEGLQLESGLWGQE
jgi:AhpD family alkylhydroperoxidase